MKTCIIIIILLSLEVLISAGSRLCDMGWTGESLRSDTGCLFASNLTIIMLCLGILDREKK